METSIYRTVNGKTGERVLLSVTTAVQYFDRIRKRFSNLAKYKSFDDLIYAQVDEYVFRKRSGISSKYLEQQFVKFLNDSNLGYGPNSTEGRTLYSLRHTYLTIAKTKGINSHQLAKQLGTSEAMIERYYSKYSPLVNPKTFAGKPY